MKNIFFYVLCTFIFGACESTQKATNSSSTSQTNQKKKEVSSNYLDTVDITTLKPFCEIQNPSFEEDEPERSKTPQDWESCCDLSDPIPDIHGTGKTILHVEQSAYHGKNFLGLTTMNNDNWTGISQKLSQPIETGKHYFLSLYACHAQEYKFISKYKWSNEDYDEPVRIRVLGSNQYFHKRELLFQTKVVKSTEWKQYTLRLSPKENHTHIFIEAYYKEDTFFPYNGNILIDNISPIFEMPVEN